jgi:hypothetical protein
MLLSRAQDEGGLVSGMSIEMYQNMSAHPWTPFSTAIIYGMQTGGGPSGHAVCESTMGCEVPPDERSHPLRSGRSSASTLPERLFGC